MNLIKRDHNLAKRDMKIFCEFCYFSILYKISLMTYVLILGLRFYRYFLNNFCYIDGQQQVIIVDNSPWKCEKCNKNFTPYCSNYLI